MAKKKKIDWDKFYSAYKNMKRVGNGTYRKLDIEGLGMVMDSLQRKGFNDRQIEAILGNVVEESGGDPFAIAKDGVYKGLFQESNVRYPMSEFEKDKKRFKGRKREYIDYMVDRFYEHVNDSKYYAIKGTKYKRANEAVKEFTSNDANIDYSYPLVYAFEAPGDKEGTYKNRKKVSGLISKSYADSGSSAEESKSKDSSVTINKDDDEGVSKRESRRENFLYGNTGHIGKYYDGEHVRISDDAKKSVGISKKSDPEKWYRSLNPGLNTDAFSLMLDFVPTARRMLNKNNDRNGFDRATDFEEKIWKAYTNGDISELPKSKYRFDDDDDEAQYVGLPQEQSIIIQSLLDKEYINKMLDDAYDEKDDTNKESIERYKRVFERLNKNIFDNPGKWILINEEISPFKEYVYDDSEKLYGVSGLGALKNFSVRWNPDEGYLDVKDNYDFTGKSIAEKLIPERDIPLRIRERIKYNPDKGSVIRNNPNALGKRFELKFKKKESAQNEFIDPIIIEREGGDIKQKQKKAYEYFTIKRGMSQIQAIAILGNLMAESGLKDDISGDNGTSYGIQQWHNERKDALFKKARKNGHDTPTFEDQLEFLADEYEGKTGYSNFLYARKGKMGPGYYNYSRSDFQDAENLRDAVVAWNQGAGRPHKSVIRNSDRYSAALKVAKNLGFDFGLDTGAAPMYGQMGVGEDFIFHEEGDGPIDGTQPVSDTQAVSPQDTVSTTQEDMMKSWIEAYGKGIVAQLMATSGNNKANAGVDDTTERYRDYVRDSKDDEDSKRMALLQSFLPNIQLKIKGVTQVRGGQ